MPKTAEARLAQVLLWYDEPQIVLLKMNSFAYVIGVAINDESAGFPFVGATVSLRALLDYKMEKIDLRYLFLNADRRQWWLFDLSNETETVELRHVSGKSAIVDDNAPESGFFARFHDDIEDFPVEVANTPQTFNIDGSWDLGEFSQFYGQVEDIYYIFHSINEYNKPNATDKRKNKIREALTRPFRGGGSYVGLYNDIANDNDRAARLRVSGIKYHSPGYVEIRALDKPFHETIKLLQAYGEGKQDIKFAYNALHKILSQHKLLKKDARPIFSGPLAILIKDRSIFLADRLPGLSFATLLGMTEGNTLIASKVLLSVVRRVERLYQFFDEGRAKHAEINVD